MSSIQITVRSISNSPAITHHIQKYFSKLNKMYNKIGNCRVVIDVDKNHNHKDKIFSVSIDLAIPGRELISRKKGQNLYLVIRNGFAALEKLLAKHMKKQKMVNKYLVPSIDQNKMINMNF